MKQPTSWQPVSRIKWRHYVIIGLGIMPLYLCTKTFTISSRGPTNLSNFLFERQPVVNKTMVLLRRPGEREVNHGWENGGPVPGGHPGVRDGGQPSRRAGGAVVATRVWHEQGCAGMYTHTCTQTHTHRPGSDMSRVLLVGWHWRFLT